MLVTELFEAKPKKDVIVGKLPPQRNPIAVAAQKRSGSGAGYHEPKKYTRKEKHKKDVK